MSTTQTTTLQRVGGGAAPMDVDSKRNVMAAAALQRQQPRAFAAAAAAPPPRQPTAQELLLLQQQQLRAMDANLQHRMAAFAAATKALEEEKAKFAEQQRAAVEGKEAKLPDTVEGLRALAADLERQRRVALERATQVIPPEVVARRAAMVPALEKLRVALEEVEKLYEGGIKSVGEIWYDETKSAHVEAAGRMNVRGVTESAQDRSALKGKKHFGDSAKHLQNLRNYFDAVVRTNTNAAISVNKERREGGELVDERKEKDKAQDDVAKVNKNKRPRTY